MTFVFYDHPVQFAAILMDDELRPLEHVNLRCFVWWRKRRLSMVFRLISSRCFSIR